jgi:hypothetical protein
MKTRIVKLLGIGLTLAIVASMFVFAAPVSAFSETNDKFFPVTFSLSSSTTVRVDKWNGPETVLSDGVMSVTKPGLVRVSELVISYKKCTGDFGPLGIFSNEVSVGSVATLTIKSVTNFVSNKMEYIGFYYMDFGPRGTLSLHVHNQREFKYFYPPGSTTEVWDADATLTSTVATGELKNLQISGSYWFDYSSTPSGVLTMENIGWLSPK